MLRSVHGMRKENVSQNAARTLGPRLRLGYALHLNCGGSPQTSDVTPIRGHLYVHLRSKNYSARRWP